MTALQIPTFSPPRNLRSANHYYHSWKDFTSNYSSKIKDCKFAKHLQRMTALQIPTFSPPRNSRSANYYYHSWKDFTSNYSSKIKDCKFAKHLQRMTALQIPTFSPPRNLRSANYYYHSWKDFTSNYSSKKLQICKHLLPCCYILYQLLNDPCHLVETGRASQVGTS
jgi:hypothetical protein